MAGLPGTGKTTLARALAERMNGAVISKDEVRAALFPGRLIDYSSEQDDLCMDAVLDATAYLARLDRVPFVFVDGRTFARVTQIEQAIEAAESSGAAWKILHLSCSDEVAQKRLEDQQAEDHPAGNRDFALYQELKSRFEPITRPKLDVDTSQHLEETVRQSEQYLAG